MVNFKGISVNLNLDWRIKSAFNKQHKTLFIKYWVLVFSLSSLVLCLDEFFFFSCCLFGIDSITKKISIFFLSQMIENIYSKRYIHINEILSSYLGEDDEKENN